MGEVLHSNEEEPRQEKMKHGTPIDLLENNDTEVREHSTGEGSRIR